MRVQVQLESTFSLDFVSVRNHVRHFLLRGSVRDIILSFCACMAQLRYVLFCSCLRHSTWPNSGIYRACSFVRTTNMVWVLQLAGHPLSLTFIPEEILSLEYRSVSFLLTFYIVYPFSQYELN